MSFGHTALCRLDGCVLCERPAHDVIQRSAVQLISFAFFNLDDICSAVWSHTFAPSQLKHVVNFLSWLLFVRVGSLVTSCHVVNIGSVEQRIVGHGLCPMLFGNAFFIERVSFLYTFY